MPQLPIRSPLGVTAINVIGGENLFRLAELYLDDATQWWRIWALNAVPGGAPNFIIQAPGLLQLPNVNTGATWP